MPQKEPHTIVASERAWAQRVIAICAVCNTVAVAFALALWPPTAPEVLLVAVSALLIGIELRHLAYGEISIGLIPIAAAALGPVSLALYLGRGNLLALAGAMLGLGVATFTLTWFSFMALATRPIHDTSETGTAIVLGCAVKRGRPSTTLKQRLDTAITLWQRHPPMHFIVTGGVSDPREPSEASVMADYLVRAGIPAEQVHTEGAALNTEENFAHSKTLIDELGLPSPIWLVTSDYHMWRAARLARMNGLETIPCAAKTPSTTRLLQWCREVLVICFGS